MSNSAMPERIFIAYHGFDNKGCALAFDTSIKMRDGTDFSPYEYVRADLIQGDANEPLEDGQYRWIKTEHGWEPALVCHFGAFDLGRFELMTTGEDESITLLEDDALQIGPVIRPPEGI